MQDRYPKRVARHAHCAGFTLIELLTVIAVIAILATLTLSAVARVRMKSGETQCSGNLRQVVLGIEMYQDESGRRPRSLSHLAAKPALIGNPRAFICPADWVFKQGGVAGQKKTVTNASWGAFVNGAQEPFWAKNAVLPDEGSWEAELRETTETVPFSCLHSLAWQRLAWDTLAAIPGNQGGLVSCELHGIRILTQNNLNMLSFRDYEGRTFRAQRDGAVVRRRIVRSTQQAASGDTLVAPAKDSNDYPWEFYADSTFKIRK